MSHYIVTDSQWKTVVIAMAILVKYILINKDQQVFEIHGEKS